MKMTDQSYLPKKTKTLSTSPERGSFARSGTRGKAADLIHQEFYDTIDAQIAEQEASADFAINNLEYDLRTTDWILEKVRADEKYAQKLYAALCNTEWQRHDVLPILRDETWSCSWRFAGCIIANMRGEGDYIDWYMSGMTHEIDEITIRIPEGHVDEEVLDDLNRLGWILYSSEDIG
jgi:hypothetical protein